MADYDSLDPLEQAYLEHYGVIGMKWGVRRTPQQLGHKPQGGKDYKAAKGIDPNSAEKRANAAKKPSVGERFKSYRKKVAEEKAAKDAAKKAAAEKAAKEERDRAEAEKKAAWEKEKADILKSPTKIFQNLDKLSKAEVDAAMAQYDWEQKVKKWAQESQPKKQSVEDRIKQLTNYGNTINNATTTVITGYTNFAKIWNTFRTPDMMELPMPKQGGNQGQQQKQENQVGLNLSNAELSMLYGMRAQQQAQQQQAQKQKQQQTKQAAKAEYDGDGPTKKQAEKQAQKEAAARQKQEEEERRRRLRNSGGSNSSYGRS